MSPRALAVSVLAVTTLLAGCGDFLHEAAPPEPVPLSLTTTFSTIGPTLNQELADAFDQTNRVRVRVETEATGALLLDEEFAVSPDEEGIRLRLNIDLGEEDRLRVVVSVVLFRDALVLFEGSFVTELVRGTPASGEVPLVPRATDLVISGPELITALQASIQLQAALFMGTGNPIPDPQITWVSLDQGILSVSGTGLVTSLTEGEGRIVALSQGLADTLRIAVSAVVAQVTVTPPTATLAPGAQATFTAVARDSGGNPLVRTPVWTTEPATVASVNTVGRVTALTTGTAQVRATVEGVTGTATVEVSAPPPVVVTGAVTNITATAGQLSGTVNARGFPSTAWFEYGLAPNLSDGSDTPRIAVGSGLEPIPFQQFIRDLPSSTTVYYRIAAGNVGGEARGNILSFLTGVLTPPAAPSNLRYEPFFLFESFAGFELAWDVNSDNEEFFELDRRESGENFFSLLVEPGPRQSSYIDTSARPWDFDFEDLPEYDYRIRACNAAGCSTYSEIFGVYFYDGYFPQPPPAVPGAGSR